jgi:DNA transposition AAA+ family ATPase
MEKGGSIVKEKFVITKNVSRFQAILQKANHKKVGMERMGLVFGKAGYGKTEAAIRYAAQNGAVLVRTKELMTGRWFLRELIWELGQLPEHSTQEIFKQIIGTLREKPRTIIIDEIDRFALKTQILETIRDIHDTVKCPIIMIGEDQADHRLMKYPRLYDRLIAVIKFEPLDKDDVKRFTQETSDYRFEQDAIEKITLESQGKIRKVVNLINDAEDIAEIRSLKIIGAKDLKWSRD